MAKQSDICAKKGITMSEINKENVTADFEVTYRDGQPDKIEWSSVSSQHRYTFSMDGETAVLQTLQIEPDDFDGVAYADVDHARAVVEHVEDLPFVQAVKGL